MNVMRKFDGLRDDGAQRAEAVVRLAADGPALLKGLVRLINAARLIRGGGALLIAGSERRRARTAARANGMTSTA